MSRRPVDSTRDIRVFQATEFDFLNTDITAILNQVTRTPPEKPYVLLSTDVQFSCETSTQGYGFIPGVVFEREVEPFMRNKKIVADYFLAKLVELYIAENTMDPSVSSYADAYRRCVSDQIAGESSLFSITSTTDENIFKVRVPFRRSSTPSTLRIIEAAKRSVQSISEGRDKQFLLVSKAKLKEIYDSLKAKIDSQTAMYFIADYAPQVELIRKQLQVDKHQYRSIYDGARGVAYQGQGVRGFIASSYGSLFSRDVPSNNLEKVIRLLRNYLNPAKSATRTHFPEVNRLIGDLETLAPRYEEMDSSAVDPLILEKLQVPFQVWAGTKEHGSAMRRVVFAMSELIQAVGPMPMSAADYREESDSSYASSTGLRFE